MYNSGIERRCITKRLPVATCLLIAACTSGTQAPPPPIAPLSSSAGQPSTAAPAPQAPSWRDGAYTGVAQISSNPRGICRTRIQVIGLTVSGGEVRFGDGPLYDGDPPASAARVGGPGFGLAPGPDAPFHDNFGSYHPGICQFLMADGGVRALANGVSEDVLGRLTTRGE